MRLGLGAGATKGFGGLHQLRSIEALTGLIEIRGPDLIWGSAYSVHIVITYIHTYIHACLHACMHACIQKHIHTDMYMGVYNLYIYMHIYIHTYR